MNRQDLFINWISVNLRERQLWSRYLSRIVLLKQKDVQVTSFRSNETLAGFQAKKEPDWEVRLSYEGAL